MVEDIVQRRHLRPAEAAKYAGFSKSKLDKLRLFGDGPVFIKAGRVVLYRLDDLDRWLAARRRTSTSEDGGASRKDARSSSGGGVRRDR